MGPIDGSGNMDTSKETDKGKDKAPKTVADDAKKGENEKGKKEVKDTDPTKKKKEKKQHPHKDGINGDDYSSDSSSSKSSDHEKDKDKGKDGEDEPEPPPIPETRHTEEAAAAVVSAALSLMYHLVPVREPLRFKITIGCSIDMELSARPPYPKLYAKVFFKDTDDNPRRTRVAQWAPNARIDWDQDEFESLVGPVSPCEVSVQVHQDHPDQMIMNKMYQIDWLKVHASINHDKTWGFPLQTSSHGTGRLYICCRCTDGRPREVTDFSLSPLPELHASLPNSPPAAAFKGGLISNNGDGAAGRKLFNFFWTNCRDKLHQVPELLRDYQGREDYLIDMHATVYRWWDWGTDPVEIGNWFERIPPKEPSKRRKRATVKE